MAVTAGGFTVVAIGTGVLLGYLRGGRLRRLADANLRGAPLLVAGVVLQAVAEPVRGALGLTLVTLSYAALIGMAAMNWRVMGIAVAGVGLALNALVIIANAGMPVRASAIASAGIASRAEARELDIGGKRRLEREGDVLLLLADVIPVPPLRAVLSFGDLVLAMGLAHAVASLMRRPSPVAAPPVVA